MTMRVKGARWIVMYHRRLRTTEVQNVHYLLVDTLLLERAYLHNGRHVGKKGPNLLKSVLAAPAHPTDKQAVSFVTDEIISKPLID